MAAKTEQPEVVQKYIKGEITTDNLNTLNPEERKQLIAYLKTVVPAIPVFAKPRVSDLHVNISGQVSFDGI